MVWQAMVSIVALISKSTEEERPIALTSYPYRLRVRTRWGLFQEWVDAFVKTHTWDRARKGLSSLHLRELSPHNQGRSLDLWYSTWEPSAHHGPFARSQWQKAPQVHSSSHQLHPLSCQSSQLCGQRREQGQVDSTRGHGCGGG